MPDWAVQGCGLGQGWAPAPPPGHRLPSPPPRGLAPPVQTRRQEDAERRASAAVARWRGRQGVEGRGRSLRPAGRAPGDRAWMARPQVRGSGRSGRVVTHHEACSLLGLDRHRNRRPDSLPRRSPRRRPHSTVESWRQTERRRRRASSARRRRCASRTSPRPCACSSRRRASTRSTTLRRRALSRTSWLRPRPTGLGLVGRGLSQRVLYARLGLPRAA